MIERFKTLIMCLNRIGCPKDIKGLIKNKIFKKKVKIDYFGYKFEWFELFGKKHGLRRAWHRNGQLWSEYMYRDDKMNGLYRAWCRNGQLSIECVYKDGKKNGPERCWDTNGQVYKEIMYKDGEEIEILN